MSGKEQTQKCTYKIDIITPNPTHAAHEDFLWLNNNISIQNNTRALEGIMTNNAWPMDMPAKKENIIFRALLVFLIANIQKQRDELIKRDCMGT